MEQVELPDFFFGWVVLFDPAFGAKIHCFVRVALRREAEKVLCGLIPPPAPPPSPVL